jgi:hypothetical protein
MRSAVTLRSRATSRFRVTSNCLRARVPVGDTEGDDRLVQHDTASTISGNFKHMHLVGAVAHTNTDNSQIHG